MIPTAFVSQQDAYTEVQSQLDLAKQLFDNTSYPDTTFDENGIPTEIKQVGVNIARDLNFSEYVDDFGKDAWIKWIKACNSLKARYYLHMKDYTNALNYAKLGIEDPSGT